LLGVSGINVKKKGWQKIKKNSKIPKQAEHPNSTNYATDQIGTYLSNSNYSNAISRDISP
jgi:hypothetical protein